MNVFFDNCTSPVLATTLHGFIQHEHHNAWHIRDVPGLPNGRHSTDIEWISHLRESPENWMFITGDAGVLRNRAERMALKNAGLHGFVLAPAYQKTPLHQIASLLIWKWPEMLTITELLSAPSMHEIPIRKTTKLKQISL